MIKRQISILIIILSISASLSAQNTQDATLKREITLYNPYKPSLPDVVKKSYMPDMTDTSRVRPDFRYDVRTWPFSPPYVVSPIKAATMQPDALPKLYNSWVNIGFGNYVTPLAELSIANQRSKKGSIGLYGRHFSTNGKVKLENSEKVFSGFMDNDLAFYGKKFMKKSNFYGSGFFSQKTRYAYGYDTSDVSYVPDKKDIRLNYYITGAELGLASSGLDSTDFAYDFGIDYSFFLTESPFWQHSLGIRGEMAKMWNKFYAGANTGLEYYKPSDTISADSKYIFFVNPFIKKSTREWDVKLGFNALIDKGLDEKAKIHIYPDVLFGFNIIPAYVSFFAELSGRMDRNEPLDVISQNPFLLPGVSVYRTVNTDYALVVRAGFSGETGIDGTYKLSASYSLVNDMLLFSNYNLRDGAEIISRGNYFNVIRDQAEILNVHGDYAARISKKFAVETAANYYRYTLSAEKYPWNKPGWDASFAIKYMLQDKIIAGAGMNALGKTQGQLTSFDLDLFMPPTFRTIEIPAHLSFRLSAEYRFTKILSFWFKADNISFTRAYEWAFYPTQRFICLLGFSYSL